MPVGLAFSGGGIVALLGAGCSIRWMAEAFPGIFHEGSDVLISTVSGGSLGNALFVNAGNRLSFPDYEPAISYEKAKEQTHPAGKQWFATGLNVLPPVRRLVPNEESGEARRRGLIPGWTDVVDKLYSYEYGIKELKGGNVTWYTDFGFANASACPVTVDGNGSIIDPRGIGMGYREMRTGEVYPPGVKASPLDALAWSSAFWATQPLQSNILEWEIVKHELPQDDAHYFADGGLIDPAAITNLLRAGASSVVAFYNNIGDIRKRHWQIELLFGKNVEHQAFSNMGGAATQVFPREHVDEVIANLTNPNILFAKLENVQVVKNDWLGIRPYKLKTLIIMSLMRSEEFLDTFQDKRIKAGLSSSWPSGFHSGMGTLNANLFCMFQEWRGERHKSEIEAAIRA